MPGTAKRRRRSRRAILFKTVMPACCQSRYLGSVDRSRVTTIATLEPTARPMPAWRDLVASLDRHTAMNATVALLYAITGPLAVLLAVGSKVGFTHDQVAAWIFGGYAVGGFLSVLMSWMYRQPIGVAWSIPGAILIGPALDHLSFPEIVGAGIATGLLIAVLAITGWVRKVMSLCPLPVVMGMVCGVFLPFGLKIITGFEDDPGIAFSIVVAFVASSAVPAIERVLPPVLAALAAGIVAVIVTGHGAPTAPVRFGLAHLNILMPQFSLRALLELVLPLTITVIGIHNPQGFAVLEVSNYRPPVNALTLACGSGSILSALLGSVPICVADPSNAVMCSSGRAEQRVVAGIVYGLLFLAFGIFAPVAADLSSTLPIALIDVLGGLALLRALQSWMTIAFGSDLSLGALIAFLVALSGISIFHISAPFWGLVFGAATSWLVDRATLRAACQARLDSDGVRRSS
jgi:benzoate membrane transport protein